MIEQKSNKIFRIVSTIRNGKKRNSNENNEIKSDIIKGKKKYPRRKPKKHHGEFNTRPRRDWYFIRPSPLSHWIQVYNVWTRIERVSHHEFLSVIPKNIDQNFSSWFRAMSQHFFRCQRKSYHVFIDYPIFSNTCTFFFYSYIQGNRCQKANSSWCASLSVNISHKTFMFMWFVLSCLLPLETLRILRIFSWISYFLTIWLIEWFNRIKIENI